MSAPAGRLVSVGNVVVDVVAHVPALPAAGADVTATGAGLEAGGAFNALAAAARQGWAAAYGGAHGTGPLGDVVRAGLAREGVEVLTARTPDRDTGFVVALVDRSGERTFVTAPGAERTLTAERLAAVRARPGDSVHVSGYGLAGAPNRASITAWLHALPAGVTVLFDPGPLRAPVPAAVREVTDWWSGNQAEAAAATGTADPVAAAERLAAGGAGRGVVVRLGPAGCVLRPPGGPAVTVPGFAVDAVDTNGAGDAHVGIWLAALAAGLDPPDAARRANAGAAIAVTRRGPATAPTAAEIDRFVDRPGPGRSPGTGIGRDGPGRRVE